MGEFIAYMALLFALGGVIAILVLRNEKKAYAEYRACLNRLKKDPRNPDLREEALELGRKYATICRFGNGLGRTVFDEVAIMNDQKWKLDGSRTLTIMIGPPTA